MGEWFATLKNIRQMHSGSFPPAGVAKDLQWNKDGLPILRSKVVEPTAIKLLDEGVYQGYSLGIFDPIIYPDPKAPNGRIGKAGDAGWVGEVSLVDVPSCPTALYSLVKMANKTATPEELNRVELGGPNGERVPLQANHMAAIVKAFSVSGGEGFRAALRKIVEAETRPAPTRRPRTARPKVSAPRRRNRMSNVDEARLSADLQAAISGATYAGDIAGAAVSAAVTKSLSSMPALKGDDADDEVDDAIDELMGDLGDAVDAQDDDEDEEPGKPTDDAVSDALGQVADDLVALSAAQAADRAVDQLKAMKGKCKACMGSGDISGVKCAKCGGSGLKAKKAKAPEAMPDEAMPDEAMGKRAAKAVRAAEAAKWYGLVKRDMDPNVGGGVDRDKLKAGDFVFPATKDFPVVTPGDVDDAVKSWGRYKGTESFDSFKSKLSALAERKGPKFVAALPDSWDAQKSAKASAESKQKPCPSCKGEGTILDGNRECPDCHGTGTKPASLAKPKKEKTVTDTAETGVTVKAKKPKAPKQKGNLKPIDAPDLPEMAGDAPPAGNNMGKKTKKSNKAAQRVHDMLCPAFPAEAVKSAYPGAASLPLADLLNPRFFADRLAALTNGTKPARPDSVGAAYQALAAANKLAGMEAPTFERLREAAAKSFMDAYPTVRLSPGMVTPEQFRRGFLAQATPETSQTTRVPTPDLSPSLSADQFTRAPLTDNETRPSLMGGSSVTGYSKKAAKKADKNGGVAAPVPSRLFYRNTDKNEWSSAMSLLHDHIAQHFPGSCPMQAAKPGTNIDSDGLMGAPAEMNASGPSLPALVLPSGAVGDMSPVKAAKVGKGPVEGQSDEALKVLVSEQVSKAVKPLRRQNVRLSRRLAKAKTELAKPDRSRAPIARTHPFAAPTVDPDVTLKAAQAKARVAELKTRVTDRSSDVAGRAMAELQGQLSPKQFATLLVADED